MSSLEQLRGWRGSAQELVALLREVMPGVGLLEQPPNVRTIRYWRANSVLGRSAGRSFSEREALEALSTLVLRARGMPLETVRDALRLRTNEELYEIIREASRTTLSIVEPESGVGDIGSFAEATVILLAQGLLSQHDAVRGGEIVRQGDWVPGELREAMRRLGRLYIEQGDEDRAASVHSVIERCRIPLREWGLKAFGGMGFGYSDSVLVDTDLRVPTVECEEIARSLGAWGADNVVERQLHDRLREALDALGEGADHAYTSVRAFLGRRSLATRDELYGYCDENGLPLRLSELLARDFYKRVPEAWTVGGRANRCAHCGTLLRPLANARLHSGMRCPLPACRETKDTEIGERLLAEKAMVCKPEILTYWVNPAVDELRVYEAARDAGLPCELYPRGDLCDVVIDGGIGVDVKAYASPVTLASKMNRSIGGLTSYERRILAIPDYVARRRSGYLDVLEDALEGEEAVSLEVMAVSGVLQLVEEVAVARRA